jgi:hypothetical protein
MPYKAVGEEPYITFLSTISARDLEPQLFGKKKRAKNLMLSSKERFYFFFKTEPLYPMRGEAAGH